MSWGRPYRLVSPSSNCSSPQTTPIQIGSGALSSAVLTCTQSGDVHARWLYESHREIGTRWTHRGYNHKQWGNYSLHVLDISRDPVRLPVLPDLPDSPATGPLEEERWGVTKLIKTSTMIRCLIGLMNKGHDLKMDDLGDEDLTRTRRHVSKSVRTIISLLRT